MALRCHLIFRSLALWEFQNQHSGSLPTELSHGQELLTIAKQLVTSAEVNKQAFVDVSTELMEWVSSRTSTVVFE